MNANNIWAGEWYAYYPYKGNKTFIMNARKGKAIRVEKIKEYGKNRETAYVHFEDEHGMQSRERARDVIDFWDAYERERNGILREREERDLAQRIERERFAREREERFAKERSEREQRAQQELERNEKLVTALIERTQLPREIINSVSATLVCLDRTTLEFWLST